MFYKKIPLILQTYCKPTLQRYIKTFIKQKEMKKILELKTPKELEREQRQREVAAAFVEMRKTYPTATPWRIFNELARRFTLTSMGIMRICQKFDLYEPKGARK